MPDTNMLLAKIGELERQIAGLGTQEVDVNGLYALRFDAAQKTKLYAGQMYKSGVNLGTGYIEYIYRVLPDGQYIISVDDGGAHAWLLGHTVTDGKSIMAGNMSFCEDDGEGAQHQVSVASSDLVDSGTWHHYASLIDQENFRFTAFTDGVASKDIAIPNGWQRRITDPGLGECHIGGSHHQTASGDLLQMAIYEGANPFSNHIRPATFIPSREFGYATQDATQNYQAPNMSWYFGAPTGHVVLDGGIGYNGVNHNAVFHADVTQTGTYSGIYGTLLPATSYPQWVAVNDFAQPPYTGPSHVTPVGAVVSDSFSRIDSVPFWNGVISLGTAPTGQAWENVSGVWGIISGDAYLGNYGNQYIASIPTGLTASGGYVNMRVEGTRRAASGSALGIVARFSTPGNYIALTTDEPNTRLFLYQYIGGSPTLLQEISGQWNVNTNKIALDCVGSTVRVYVDDVLKHTQNSVTDNAPGTKAGLYGEGWTRVSRFDVFPA